MMQPAMPLNWPPRFRSDVQKTASEMRIDAGIHDKEIELTYLRQIVNIAKGASAEALSGLQAVLETATAKSPERQKITGETFDGDFRRK